MVLLQPVTNTKPLPRLWDCVYQKAAFHLEKLKPGLAGLTFSLCEDLAQDWRATIFLGDKLVQMRGFASFSLIYISVGSAARLLAPCQSTKPKLLSRGPKQVQDQRSRRTLDDTRHLQSLQLECPLPTRLLQHGATSPPSCGN